MDTYAFTDAKRQALTEQVGERLGLLATEQVSTEDWQAGRTSCCFTTL
jgi:hypothetical protein